MQDWQPIETAPKDGTEILIFIPTDEDGPYEIVLTKWDEDRPGFKHPAGDFIAPAPTHWMPLPDPPLADGTRGVR